MRSSWDVISRILHDPSFVQANITIGYWDGLANRILEKNFTKFHAWGDISMASISQLAIPQHRIRYFKHEPTGTELWNREQRIDRVFGSVTPTDKVDIEELEALCQPATAVGGDDEDATTPLQRFLRERDIHVFEDVAEVLTSPLFGCRVRQTPKLYSVMYDSQSTFKSQSSLSQRDSASDALDHCRGVIYEKDTNKLVCMAFDKFWESYDHRAATDVIDWSTATIREKCDGMLVKLYFYNNRWRIASNGMINADDAKLREAGTGVSVGSLFRDAANRSVPGGYNGLLSGLKPDHTYSFELCHPAQRIVVYHPTPRLIHLNTRIQSTGIEIEEDIDGVSKPETVPISSNLAVLQRAANQLSSQGEGYVVTDAAGRRIKIKGSEYLRAHHEEERLNKNHWFHVASAFLFPSRLRHSLAWHLLLPSGFDASWTKLFFEEIMSRVTPAGLTVAEAKQLLRTDLPRREAFEALLFEEVEKYRDAPPSSSLQPPKLVRTSTSEDGRRLLRAALTRSNSTSNSVSTTTRVALSLADALKIYDVVIMRGLSGSGKSTLVSRALSSASFTVASADTFFSRNGYAFDPRLLASAHEYSLSLAMEAIANGQKVCVDNTNVSLKEFQPYLDLCANYGLKAAIYEISCDTIEEARAFGARNQHNVPPHTIERMFHRWQRVSLAGIPVIRVGKEALAAAAPIAEEVATPPLSRKDKRAKYQSTQQKLAAGLSRLHSAKKLLYIAVFLDADSRRTCAGLARKLSSTPSALDTMLGDHATLAFHSRFPSRNTEKFFDGVAKVLDTEISLSVRQVAADNGLTAVGVDCDHAKINAIAAASDQNLHITLSAARGQKPSRSSGLLAAGGVDLPEPYLHLRGSVKCYLSGGKVLGKEDLLELFSDSTTNSSSSSTVTPPPPPLQQSRQICARFVVFDMDKTLLMTPSRETFAASMGRKWRGGGYYDSEASLDCVNLPVSPGPALERLLEMKKAHAGDESTKFVLCTGRIQALQEAALTALEKFGVSRDVFDGGIYLRPRKLVTAPWKGDVVRDLVKGFWDLGGGYCEVQMYDDNGDVRECVSESLRSVDEEKGEGQSLIYSVMDEYGEER
jgi:predicted kinase